MNSYLKTSQHLFLELIMACIYVCAFVLVDISHIDGIGTHIRPLLLGVCSLAFFWRIIWNSALVIHGLGHVCMTALLDQDLRFIKSKNVLENRSFAELLESCIPGNPIFLPWIASGIQPWVSIGTENPQTIRFKALGGIAFNIIAILLLLPILSPLPIKGNLGAISVQLLASAWIWSHLFAALSSRSDIAAAISGSATCFYCGNFGFLGKRRPEDGHVLLPARAIKIYQTMGKETEIRGAQAGGGATFARDREGRPIFVGKKLVNRKRQNLTRALESAFSFTRRKAMAMGAKASEKVVVGAWHYRYGTSSPPAIVETHWHEWTPAKEADVWRVEQGEWICDRKWVNHRITHNGDFDAWKLFDQPVENIQLGLWLERVLHYPNAAIGDSPKIAGMMDLLVTQGRWSASLRLAYQMGVATSITEAFGGKHLSNDAPNTAPSEEQIEVWAAIAQAVFEKHSGTLLLPYADSMLEVSRQRLTSFEQALLQALLRDRKVKGWTRSQQSAFVKNAVYAFLHNNLYQAVKIFMSKAVGTFGLAAFSTLSEESLVLSALRQPMTTGFNVQDEYMVYASEPAAVDAVLVNNPRSYRLDLDQKRGEVAWVSADNITVYSISEDRERLSTELEQRWMPVQGNPYISPPAAGAKDPVEYDIQDISRVLAEVDSVWQDPTSYNRQSADYLAELLIERANVWRQEQRAAVNVQPDSNFSKRPLDLLITGTENSFWLGEQFAKDLLILFPGLQVQAISSNQVLRKLRDGHRKLRLGEHSIVLAISQSGQTFPTLQATQAFEALCQQQKIGELFLMTGELCSLMGSAISQYYYPDSSFTRRIFVNGSGRRMAEPATVAIAAAHASLTAILLNLSYQLRSRFPDRQGPFNMFLTKEHLLHLEQMKDNLLKSRVVSLTGSTFDRKPVKSVEHQTFVRGGQQWAAHIIEPLIVWAVHAAYIVVTVGLGVPPVQTLFHTVRASWLLPVATLTDILMYIFGPWLWAIGLRYLQKRSLMARTGNRTIVIGDVPWVHRLLQSYVSKLFSLSYGIASPSVHSSNPKDHFLHYFGHRITRGTLLFLGIPDGRYPVLKHDENAVIMTGQQASGVRHLRAGAEIVALGHNPAITHQGFQNAIVLASNPSTIPPDDYLSKPQIALEQLQESRFSAFERLLAGYVFFWALAKRVSSFPLLRYQHWKSQSRTRIMTTAAPIARTTFKRSKPKSLQMKVSAPSRENKSRKNRTL